MSMSMTGASGMRPKNRGGMEGSSIPRGYRAGQLQQFTPEQMQLFQSLFGQVGAGSKLAQMASGSDEGFADFENYANRQFQENTGDLASRFSGLGMGARRGSGFQNQATQSAQDFAGQLAMQRQGLQRQALQDLMGMSGMLLGQRPQEQFITPKSKKSRWWEPLLSAAGQAAGQAAGSFGGSNFAAMAV